MSKNPYILTDTEKQTLELVDYLSQWHQQFKLIGNLVLTTLILGLLSILSYHYLIN